ncbi:MAG: polyprenyl synthetase family protein [bacterium]|nr:polyprenyl synthetase family protein [bacterium]
MSQNLNEITKTISTDLDKVNAIIDQECHSVNSSYLQELLKYTFRVRGKLLRPTLAISTSGISGKSCSQEVLWIAAGLEVLHTASLVHDDIIDRGLLRRGQATIHMEYGIGEATLLGDWLLAKSFELMTRVGNPVISHEMTILTSELTEGQFLEMEASRGKYYDQSSYMRMIDLKTASIFRYACKFACLSTPGLQSQALQMYEFGTNFGIMFQIIDDLIDLFQEDKEALKSTGRDLLNGLTTLPIFIALETEENCTEKPLKKALQNKDINYIQNELPRTLVHSGVYNKCVNVASEYGAKSLDYLPTEESGGRILKELVDFTLNQTKSVNLVT